MTILTNSRFDKQYEKLPAKIQKRLWERIDLFKENPLNPLLRNHVLRGDMSGLKAFSITGDYRVIYMSADRDTTLLVSIGTHNQVY